MLLSEITTMRVGGPARALVHATSEAALNGAWRVVGDPYSRARYLVDQGLRALSLPPSSATQQALLVELMDAREEADVDAAARARVCARTAERFTARFAALAAALTPVPVAELPLRHAAHLLTELLMLARLVADLGGAKLLPTLVDR